MRKIIIIGTLVCLLAGVSFAEDQKEKVSTTIVLKNDWSFPREGKDYTSQAICSYWQYKWFGGGVDLRAKLKNDFLEAAPYITLNYKHWYLLTGFSTNSKDQNYVQTGL